VDHYKGEISKQNRLWNLSEGNGEIGIGPLCGSNLVKGNRTMSENREGAVHAKGESQVNRWRNILNMNFLNRSTITSPDENY